MHLKLWLKQEGKSLKDFAIEIGCAPSTLTRILSEGRTGNADVMRKVLIHTRGAVTPNDFLPIDEILEEALDASA